MTMPQSRTAPSKRIPSKRLLRLALALVVGILTLVPPHAHAADIPIVGPQAVARTMPTLDAASAPSTVAPPMGRAVAPAVTQEVTATTTVTGTNVVGTWTSDYIEPTSTQPLTRTGDTTTLLNNGTVLIAGGTTTVAEIYNPATNTITRTGSMIQQRFGASATLLPNGKVLIAGGSAAGDIMLDSAELYDPATGTFAPTASMHKGYYSHQATLLPTGKVLVVGSIAELYDPETETWTLTGQPSIRSDVSTATLLRDGRVLITGMDGSQLYTPATGTFTTTGAMVYPRMFHTATLLDDGRVLIVGGRVYDSRDDLVTTGRAELFDPATGAFTLTASATPRQWHTASRLPDGTVVLIGGWSTGGNYPPNIERYDPATGTFSFVSLLDRERYGHAATVLSDGTVFVIGGFSRGVIVKPEVCDASKAKCSVIGSLSGKHDSSSVTRLSDTTVLIAGGRNGRSLDNARIYDSVTRTFSDTQKMRQPRSRHTATLLPNGKVLVVGGVSYQYDVLQTAELYDPALGTWSATGSTIEPRYHHTATLLPNGKVLVTGGYINGTQTTASAEVYDPASGTWQATQPMHYRRSSHTATLLNDGRVLIAGGYDVNGYPKNAELFDPATNTFTTTGALVAQRYSHAATLLPNGNVLLIGGFASGGRSVKTERYDPATGTFSASGNTRLPHIDEPAFLLDQHTVLMIGASNARVERYDIESGTWDYAGTLKSVRASYSAAMLADGSILIDGGGETDLSSRPEIGRFDGVNTFRGTLVVPQGWLTATTLLTLTGDTTNAALVDARLNNDPWLPVRANEATTTTLTGTSEGRARPLALQLRDANGRTATVISTSVDIDLKAPTSTMTALPATSAATFTLGWSGSDATSGVAGYDLQVRDGDTGTWTPVLTNTAALSTTFTGEQGHTYAFRVRAHDVAGNVEAWPATFDTRSEVDTVAPTGTFTLNRGALATTARVVTLTLAFDDTQSPLAEYRVAQGEGFGPWLPFQHVSTLTLTGDNGVKTVSVQVRDRVGNASAPVTQTIRLDRAAGTDYEMSINDGARWTNTLSVTLRIGAPAGATEMRLSNDGGFTGASWQAFDTRPSWLLESVRPDDNSLIAYARVRDANGDSLSIVSDNIFYDPLPPTGTITVTNVGPSNIAVALSATDQANLSGVKDMRVSTDPRFAGASWKPYATRATVPGTATRVYAQFRDVAGNISAVVSAGDGADGEYRVFLPSVRR